MDSFPKKSLGQHFLTCPWVIPLMCDAAQIHATDTLIEIGPGTGALTRELARRAGRVIAVEKDERFADILASEFKKMGILNIDIIKADILTVFSSLASRYALYSKPYTLIGNIPYYLTGRLFRIIFELEIKPSRMVFTVQKEVGERLTAKPPRANLLGLSVQAYGRPTVIKRVPASCFKPAPKVDSAIIAISDISDNFFTKRGIDKNNFFSLVHLGFSQKRKQLVNTLSQKWDKAAVVQALEKAKIPLKSRAQELSLEQWAKLCGDLD